MLAEDVYESRTTQKQGESVEYMFESRATQMQDRENDEDITNMNTPTIVACNSKVKLFFSIIIFNTCDEWILHQDMCSIHLQKYLHGSKKVWIKHGKDGL
jgi:hypothetical protein